jgi:hypothetical protein
VLRKVAVLEFRDRRIALEPSSDELLSGKYGHRYLPSSASALLDNPSGGTFAATGRDYLESVSECL